MRGHIGTVLTQCATKVRHKTKTEAIITARKMRTDARTYRCPHCGGWHIGHQFGLMTKEQYQR